MNTPKRGLFRWMIFRENDSWIGVALEFNIVVTGTDPRVVEVELHEAVFGYLESTKKIRGFRSGQVNALLNQRPETEYEEKWHSAQKSMQKKSTQTPLSPDIYKVGISNLVMA
ncbi:MAG TPA: hypothetical protein VI957_00430 [Candidatus Paceibacterota bacterium]